MALQAYDFFHEVQEKSARPTTKVPRQKIKWIPLCAPLIKINWDVALCIKSKRIGIGVVVRDHLGLVLGYLSSSSVSNPNPILAKSYAL